MKMHISQERLGYLAVLFSGLLWGFIGLFVKKLSSLGINADMISLMRIGFSFLIIFLFCFFKLGYKSLSLPRKNLIACAFLGILTQGIYNILYNKAIFLVGVLIPAVILYLSPVFTMLLSYLLFSEPLTKVKCTSLVLNVLGCILTVTNGHISIDSVALIGILFAFGAAFCYALAAIISKYATSGGSALLTTMYSFFFASLFMIFKIIFSKESIVVSSDAIIWGFLYALIPTSFSYLVYYIGVGKIKATSKVPLLASVEVVVASFIGVFIYKEYLGLISLCGIVMVLSSILVMSVEKEK